MDINSKRLLALSLAKDIGEVTIGKLLKYFDNDIAAIFSATASELATVPGMGAKRVNHVQAAQDMEAVEAELQRCEDHDITLLSLDSPQYPAQLKDIFSAPMFLYVHGNVDCLSAFCFAVVGSRRCNHYGKDQARRYAGILASAGIPIVSGMARGIDTSAHNGALERQGTTVAVLGCGIDVCYPPENFDLKNDIVDRGGAVITEYPFGVQPLPGNFPKRNRIISGLSQGVLVIQAGLKSGALLTANWALEHNRDVFAIPDRIDVPYSAGSHRLIQDGATLVMSAEDILRNYSIDSPSASKDSKATASVEKTITLPSLQQAIYDVIQEEEIHVDEIVAATEMAASEVSGILLRLTMAGHIRQLPGMFYQRVTKK